MCSGGYDAIAEQFDRQAEQAGSFALTFENAEFAEVTLVDEPEESEK